MEFQVRVLVDRNIDPTSEGLIIDTQVLVPGDLVFLYAQSNPFDRTVYCMNRFGSLDKYLSSVDAGDTIVVLQGAYSSYVYRFNAIHGWVLEFAPTQGGVVPVPGPGDVNKILYVTGGGTYGLEATSSLGIPGTGSPGTVFCGTASGNQFLPNPEITSLTADGYVQTGTNPAKSGALRTPNANGVVARNAANNADIPLIEIDSSNIISLGNVTQLLKGLSLNLYDHLSIGLDGYVSTTGALRLSNAETISARNAANNADLALLTLNSSNQIVLGSTIMPATPVSGDVGKLLYVSAASTLAFATPNSLGLNGILTTTTQSARDALSPTGQYPGCELITQDYGLTWTRPSLLSSDWFLVSPNPLAVSAVVTAVTDVTVVYTGTPDGQTLVNGAPYLLPNVAYPGIYFYNTSTTKFDTALFTTIHSNFSNGFEVFVKYGTAYGNSYWYYNGGVFAVLGVGNQGLQGPQGWQGFQGNQGWQGNQGFQGNQGNQGLQGPQGWQGFQGNQGRQGNQGWQGNQGNQGNQGVQGPTVVTGLSTLSFINGFEIDGSSNVETIAQSIPSTGTGADLVIEAQSGGGASTGDGGDLILRSGDAGSFGGATTGNVEIAAGTTGVASIELNSIQVYATSNGTSTTTVARPPTGFAVYEDIEWYQFTTTATSEHDIAIALAGYADGVVTIDLQMQARGGTIFSARRSLSVIKSGSSITASSSWAILDDIFSPPPSYSVGFSGTTVNFGITPGNSTSTTWTIKVGVMVS